jgi:hypothetical protein
MTNSDCPAGNCCNASSCEPTADACLKCPDEPNYGNCTEVGCNVALPCLTVNGIDVLEALRALDDD